MGHTKFPRWVKTYKMNTNLKIYFIFKHTLDPEYLLFSSKILWHHEVHITMHVVHYRSLNMLLKPITYLDVDNALPYNNSFDMRTFKLYWKALLISEND